MKNILSIIVILILASITFSACKKSSSDDGKTIVNGIVVSYPSKQPLAGKKVYLVLQGLTLVQYDMNLHWQFFYLDSLVRPPKYRIDSAITDANGRYSLSYTPGNCPGFPCNGVYYPTILDPNYVVVSPRTYRSSDTIMIDQASYFKVNLHKNTAASMTDTLFETRYFYNERNEYFFESNFRKGQIGQANTTITDTISTNAYSKVILEWRHYKNGLQSTSIDTINLIPNGTTIWNVNY